MKLYLLENDFEYRGTGGATKKYTLSRKKQIRSQCIGDNWHMIAELDINTTNSKLTEKQIEDILSDLDNLRLFKD